MITDLEMQEEEIQEVIQQPSREKERFQKQMRRINMREGDQERAGTDQNLRELR